jgi:hypothetical protein
MTNKHHSWLCAALGVFSLAGTVVSGQTTPAATKVKMTEDAYKNIEILKGIPADQLIPAMQFITYSLGVECSKGDSITTYDGDSGWTSVPDRPTRDIPGPEAASVRAETDLQLPIDFKQLFSELRTGKPEKIGDHDVFVVSGLNAGQPAGKFYFDEHSGLLLRLLRYVDSPLGRNPTQIDYADYRDQGGVKIPFQRTIARPGARSAIQIEQAKDNVTVDDAKFTKPAAPPPPKPPSP